MPMPSAPCFFHNSGGLSFYGIWFPTGFAGQTAQGLYVISCILLACRYRFWYLDQRPCRQPFVVSDARHLWQCCVDRRSAAGGLFPFSYLRFCGFYFRPRMAASGWLCERFSPWLCLSGCYSFIWFGWLAASAASVFQHCFFSAGSVSFLAASDFPEEGWLLFRDCFLPRPGFADWKY